MREVGDFSLLCAFLTSAYAAFACIAGSLRGRPTLLRAGVASAAISFATLTLSLVVLAIALLQKDFRFSYVASYSSRLLPWHYSLSALWVGQAGSLLLWAWLQTGLAMGFCIAARQRWTRMHQTAFGLLMFYSCFLVCTMVFGVNPLERNIAEIQEGVGLSPLLQHPAMLIHPPIVFLGYAAWAVPCALAVSALFEYSTASARHAPPTTGTDHTTLSLAAARRELPVSAAWIPVARPWALFAWMVLGSGILLGAQWSYEELGWGGYWGWDPVENGSLLPWLTGTAFLHGMMAWHKRGILKKSTLVLALATFGLCNFATFLTRSGIFSSLHAFSQSPIGWLFLGLMGAVGCLGGWAVVSRRQSLTADNPIATLVSCESQIVISAVALLLLAAVVLTGTLSAALSEAIIGRRVVVGTAFYNNVLMPISLTLLGSMAFAPLLRWGRGPTAGQKRGMRLAGTGALAVTVLAVAAGVRQPLAIAITGLVALIILALLTALWIDAKRINPASGWRGIIPVLSSRRRQYTGFLMHLGFASIAIGVTGSALGSQQQEIVIRPGQTVDAGSRSVQFVALQEEQQPDKFIAAAELRFVESGGRAFTLRPAQHFHNLQKEWTTEVAVDATWTRDVYVILNQGESDGTVRLTLIENPLMRWLWLGGFIMATGTLLALLPGSGRRRIEGTQRGNAEVSDRPVTVRHARLKKGA